MHNQVDDNAVKFEFQLRINNLLCDVNEELGHVIGFAKGNLNNEKRKLSNIFTLRMNKPITKWPGDRKSQQVFKHVVTVVAKGFLTQTTVVLSHAYATMIPKSTLYESQEKTKE